MASLRSAVTPTRLVLGFGIVTIITLVVAASTSSAAFGLYNTGWDGASQFDELVQETNASMQLAQDTRAYQNIQPGTTIAFILSPEQAYTPRDQTRLRSFVRAGGTLVVAADYGPHANRLLTAVGADARIDGRPLRDEQTYYQSPAMPIARTTAAAVSGDQAVTLNHGTAVVPHTASVVVETSGYAYLDANTNGEPDPTESMRAYPIATSEQVGAGRVIVVSDPSIFINAMLERAGNRAFTRQLIRGHEQVLLDYSHTASIPLLARGLLLVRESPLIQLLCGLLGTLLIAGIARSQSRLRTWCARITQPAHATQASTDVADTELLTHLHRQYPDWDADTLQRIVATRHTHQHADDEADADRS